MDAGVLRWSGMVESVESIRHRILNSLIPNRDGELLTNKQHALGNPVVFA